MERRQVHFATALTALLAVVLMLALGLHHSEEDDQGERSAERQVLQRIDRKYSHGERRPLGPEQWNKFDGRWCGSLGDTSILFDLDEGIGYCTFTVDEQNHVWVIELLDVFEGGLLEFGLYPQADASSVSIWTGRQRDDGAVDVFRDLFHVWPLPRAPFTLRRR